MKELTIPFLLVEGMKQQMPSMYASQEAHIILDMKEDDVELSKTDPDFLVMFTLEDIGAIQRRVDAARKLNLTDGYEDIVLTLRLHSRSDRKPLYVVQRFKVAP